MSKNKKNKKAWWEVCKFAALGGNHRDKYFDGWVTTGIYKLALENKTTLFSKSKDGLLNNISLDDFKNNLIKQLNCFELISSDSSYFILANEDSAIEIIKRNDLIEVDYLSTNSDFIEKASSFFDNSLLPSAKSKNMFVFMQSPFGVSIVNIGGTSTPIKEENYTSEVINDIKYSISNFNSSNPKGRLLILNGPPGTGKTYLIRGIVNEIENGIFIIMPSNLISSLAGPQLIQPLLDIKEKHSSAPIYLIVEDADQCLVPRGQDNLGDISSVLNLTDGILGASLDLRILATTNAKKLEVDSALKRPGRLCRQIEVGLLNKEEANVVFKKLTEKDITMSSSEYISLAEIYNIAHSSEDDLIVNNTKRPIAENKISRDDKKIGFLNRINS